jgi:hypothetical protein
MRTGRSRSIGGRASSRLALVIAREIELLATPHGRLLAFDVEELEAIAEHLAGLVAYMPPTVMVDAKDLAEQLGVDRDWVYANADRLGVVRLGNGPRARLRFDVEQAREALAAGGESAQPTGSEPANRRRSGRPRRRAAPAGIALIQGRSGR